MRLGRNNAGLIIALIGALMLFLPSIGNATLDTFWVTTEEDDCEQHSVDGWDSTASSYLIAELSAATWTIGFRFLSVTIPQGATIDSAFLELSTFATCPGTGCLSICYGEDADNSAVFTSNDTPVDRDKTDASDDITVIAEEEPNGENFRRFDVKTIMQEIVDRGGYASGNAVSFLVEDNNTAGKGTMTLLAYTWDSAFTEPKLIVGWTEAAAASQVIIIGDASDFHKPPRAYLDWRE